LTENNDALILTN